MVTVIKNGTIYQNGCLTKADVLIESEKVKTIRADLDAKKVIDAQRMLASPGLIDIHVHHCDPDQTYKEDIKTGSEATVRGGSTTIGTMPNVTLVPNTPELMKKMMEENKHKDVVHIFQYEPITNDETTDTTPNCVALRKAGASALGNNGHGVQTAQTMCLAMQKAKGNNLIIATHTQGDSFFNKEVMNEGVAAKRLDLPPVTELTETTQVARDLLLAQKTGVHYHTCHVLAKTSVELVCLAKARKINVTCRVAPHRILLTDNDTPRDNGYFKMNPLLRNKEDQTTPLAGSLDGAIDLVATDYASHAKGEEQGGTKNAIFGTTGNETVFSILYTRFVKEEKILNPEQPLVFLSDKPAKVFEIESVGILGLGKDIDVAIFDIEHKNEIKETDFKSRGVNTPSTDQKVYGEIVVTFIDGEVVYQRGTE